MSRTEGRPRPVGSAGQDWLLACAPDSVVVQRAWDSRELADFPTGLHWRVAEAPLLPSLEAIARLGGDIGPVLADVHRSVAWWLLPPDLTGELDGLRQLTVRPAGWVLKCPPVPYTVNDRWWLERPDGSGLLTAPAVLAAALSPGSAQLSTEASR
jgi:hypothetical protein